MTCDASKLVASLSCTFALHCTLAVHGHKLSQHVYLAEGLTSVWPHGSTGG